MRRLKRFLFWWGEFLKIIPIKLCVNKKRRITMKKGIMILVLTLLLVVGLGIFATQTKAKELKWKVISYITKVQLIPVGDKEGHAVGIYERRGVMIYENGEVAAYLGKGTVDWTKGNGSGVVYSQGTFKDGSTTWSKCQFTSRIPKGKKLPYYEGKGEFTKGTGRFKGIKGNYTYKGSCITPFIPDKTKADLMLEVSGTLILPQK
jgi:hypothetical protein